MKCPICNKELKSEHALRAHHWRMHTDKGKSHNSNIGYETGSRNAWNKGLTKETSEAVKLNGELAQQTMHKKMENGTYVPPFLSEEACAKISKIKSANPSGGWCKWYEVDGVKVQGTYERDLAKKMCDFNIKWIRPTKTPIPYNLNNKNKLYNPDFYLPDYDVYIEVKGHWWGNDKDKMRAVFSQNPSYKRRIKIIREPKLLKLLETKNKKEFIMRM